MTTKKKRARHWFTVAAGLKVFGLRGRLVGRADNASIGALLRDISNDMGLGIRYVTSRAGYITGTYHKRVWLEAIRDIKRTIDS